MKTPCNRQYLATSSLTTLIETIRNEPPQQLLSSPKAIIVSSSPSNNPVENMPSADDSNNLQSEVGFSGSAAIDPNGSHTIEIISEREIVFETNDGTTNDGTTKDTATNDDATNQSEPQPIVITENAIVNQYYVDSAGNLRLLGDDSKSSGFESEAFIKEKNENNGFNYRVLMHRCERFFKRMLSLLCCF